MPALFMPALFMPALFMPALFMPRLHEWAQRASCSQRAERSASMSTARLIRRRRMFADRPYCKHCKKPMLHKSIRARGKRRRFWHCPSCGTIQGKGKEKAELAEASAKLDELAQRVEEQTK